MINPSLEQAKKLLTEKETQLTREYRSEWSFTRIY